jgi:hypothetical protein
MKSWNTAQNEMTQSEYLTEAVVQSLTCRQLDELGFDWTDYYPETAAPTEDAPLVGYADGHTTIPADYALVDELYQIRLDHLLDYARGHNMNPHYLQYTQSDGECGSVTWQELRTIAITLHPEYADTPEGQPSRWLTLAARLRDISSIAATLRTRGVARQPL